MGAPIMIVDDDADMRGLLEQALELEGYPVVTASNGAELLEYLRTEPAPLVVLLDLMMPVVDGWEVLRTLQENPDLAPDVPIVIVSASGRAPVEKARAMRPGAEVLDKPVDLERLMGIVGRISERAS